MPSEATKTLYNGEPISFPEFATRVARVVHPWTAYEREFPLNAPLPDSFEGRDSTRRQKDFHEAAIELAEVVQWTPEEAEERAHQSNLSRLKGHLQTVRSAREHVRSYRFMSAQVAAWEAPTEEHESMRTAMQQQLDETFGYDLHAVVEIPPTKVTGEEYRTGTLQYLARRVLLDNEQLDLSIARIEQASAFAKEFKDSLVDWQDIEPPRRVLP